MAKARAFPAPPVLVLLLGLMIAGLWPGTGMAQVDWAREAVREVFPEGALIDRRTFFFDPDEVRRIAREAEAPMNSRLYAVFRAQRDGRTLGYAAVPTVAVRAKPATLLVRISEAGVVREVRVLAWHGAPLYRPSAAWLDQFQGATPDSLPRLGANIEPGSLRQVGARVIVQAVRRFLTIYRLRLAEDGAR